MDASSAVNACILLVDGNLANAQMTAFLLKSKYEVTTALSGGEAFDLLSQQHRFNLVLVDINLPDINCFMFVREVVSKTNLPVGVMLNYYDQPTIVQCRLNGAMLCLVKPLRSDDIQDLWQYPTLRQREEMLKSHQFPVTGSQESGPSSFGGFQGQRKRKAEELGRGYGWSSGQSSLFIGSPDRKRRFLNVTREGGQSSATFRRFEPPRIPNSIEVRNSQLSYPRAQGPSFPDETFVMVPNPLTIPGLPSATDTAIRYRDAEVSSLARYLENPYTREQLRIIINGSLRKWDLFLNLVTPLGAPTPSAPVMIPRNLMVPSMSVPAAVCQKIEDFIHITEAMDYAAPGCLYLLASRVAAIDRPLSVALYLGDGDLEPGFLESIDIDDIFDAIEELRD